MKFSIRFVVLICVMCIFAGMHPAYGSIYSETFNDTTYRDSGNTTAAWVAGSGVLTLPPYDITLLSSGLLNSQCCGDIYREGDYCYVATGSELRVFDVSDPQSIILTGTYGESTWFRGLDVDFPYAFAAGSPDGLRIISVEDPTNPMILGVYDTPGLSYEVAVSGNTAFIADQASLQIIDVGDVTNPFLLAQFVPTGGWYNKVFDVAVRGNLAYLALGHDGICVVDVSDPASPIQLALPVLGAGLDIDVVGRYAFLGNYNYWRVCDVSDPANPTQIYRLEQDRFSKAAGDYGYLGGSSLLLMDFTSMGSPNPIAEYPISTGDINVSGTQALFRISGQLLMYNVAERMSPPVEVGQYDTPGTARRIDVNGDLLAVADGAGGLGLLDIRSTDDPELYSAISLGGDVLDVEIEGRAAVVAAGSAGLHLVSTGDPSNPSVLGSVDTPGTANDVAVSGDFAFVADGDSGVQMIDISTVTAPAIDGNLPTTGAATGVAIAGDLLFIADGGGLTTSDVTDPTSPSMLGYWASPGTATGVTVAADHVFLADGDAGLQIIDVSNPATPSLTGSLNTPAYAHEVWVEGDCAYVADGSTGMIVVDIEDMTSPSVIDVYDTDGAATGLLVDGDNAFIADGSSGLTVVKVLRRKYSVNDNEAQSLSINVPLRPVFGARVSSQQTGQIEWELSANGGVNWQSFQPDGIFAPFVVWGEDLRWRAVLVPDSLAQAPVCSQLDIDWVIDVPVITAVQDVWGDQGGWVTLDFNASGFDCADVDTVIIDHYLIYRKIPDMGDEQRVSGAPAADWEVVDSTPALQQFEYSRVVPTIGNVCGEPITYTEYYVSAVTQEPDVSYDSAPDSGYSLDNRAPGVTNLVAAFNTGSGNKLTWDRPADADLNYFKIYRMSAGPYYECPYPTEVDSIYATTDTSWVDPEYDGWRAEICYRVSAVDSCGNEGWPEQPWYVTGAKDSGTPASFALFQNVPNPFNPITTIRYDIPERTAVTLRIYDVTGRIVRTLINSDVSPGHNIVTWDGKDSYGHDVSSGVYFCRLVARNFSQSRKMILLR